MDRFDGSFSALEALAFQNARVGISMVDTRGRYLAVNERYCEIVGRSREELLRSSLSDVNHPEDNEKDYAAIQNMLNGTLQSYVTEKRYVTSKGASIWARLTTKSVRNERGEITLFVGTVEDISSQKQSEQKLYQAGQQLEDVERIAPMGRWVWDVATNVVHWSDELYRIYGFDRSISPSYQIYRSIVHPEDVDEFDEIIAKGIAEKQFYKNEHRIIRPDGSIRILKNRGTIYLDSQGNLLQVIGISYDVTDLRLAEKKAKAVDLRFQQVLDAIPDLVLVKERDSRLYWANRAFREFYGMNNEELRGIIDAPFSPPDLTQQYVKDDAYVFQTGHVLEIQEPVKSHSGEVRIFHTVKSPIRDESGTIVMTVGISRDITEKLSTEEKIEEHRARLVSAAKMSALGEMAGGIAHEINNPLAIIEGLTANLQIEAKKNAPDLTKMQEGIKKIQKTSMRIAKIVKGLGFFSRNAENDPCIEADVPQIVRDTLELCTQRFRFNEVELKVGEICEISVNCRPTEIAQVLLNLLNNAHDAVAGTVNAWVSVDAMVEEDEVIFRVTDSGSGIDPIVSQRMMEPFFTTKEVGKGTGLGLSIAKGIIESHRGKLQYRSDFPNTTFFVHLPLG